MHCRILRRGQIVIVPIVINKNADENEASQIANDPGLQLVGTSFEDLPQKVNPLIEALSCDGKLINLMVFVYSATNSNGSRCFFFK